MKKRIIALSVSLFITLCAFASDNYNVLWQKGNALYNQKVYDSAAFYYEQITALKPANAVIYYNLGNTYYRLNNIPQAILNYERALHIKPDYKEAQDNLHLTQNRIGNHVQPVPDIFFVEWWRNITAPATATTWAVLSLIVFIVIIGLFILKRTGKQNSQWHGQITGILIAVWVVFLSFAFVAAGNNQSASAVVIINDAPLMNDNLRGKPLSLVPAGTTISISSEKNGWYEVRLPDGRTGWLQQNSLTKI